MTNPKSTKGQEWDDARRIQIEKNTFPTGIKTLSYENEFAPNIEKRIELLEEKVDQIIKFINKIERK